MPNILPEPLRYDELLTARKTANDSRNKKGSNDPLWRYLQIRIKEALNKYEKAVEYAIGNRRRDMFEVVHLATAPVSQGHGYATKLVRMVTAMNDGLEYSLYVPINNIVKKSKEVISDDLKAKTPLKESHSDADSSR
ncbi:hypothetical protein PHLCEN_2v9380 [Hermanssonia centrifuga]|uniref:Uncharacterized protein n=1 Tax=Hermanssonia centrifuga TaxID=98765 RepID=A0A2R6NR54_9APHY|nr:hypothetical protein PHLCEN_2v9380 [Hermanssonia centrifuga]